MSCPYEYYNKEETYYPRLYCNIDNKYCIYSKKCLKVDKYIPLDNQKECYKYNMEREKNIPSGSCFVQTSRPSANGNLYLYVVIGDRVERILSNFKSINQDFVYLREGLEGYDVSLTPFADKKTYARKKSESK